MTLRDDYKKIPQQRLDETRQIFAGSIADTPGGEVEFRRSEDTSGGAFPDEYGTLPIEKEKPYFDTPEVGTELRKVVPGMLKDAVSQNPEAPFYTTLYKTLHPEAQDPKHQNAVKTLSTLADIGLLIGEMIAASKGGDVKRRNSVLGENNKYLQNEYDRIARQKNIYRQGLLDAVMADRKENPADNAAGQVAYNKRQRVPVNYRWDMEPLPVEADTQKGNEESEQPRGNDAFHAMPGKYGIDSDNTRTSEMPGIKEKGQSGRFQSQYRNGGNKDSTHKAMLYLAPENTASYDKKNRLAVAARLQNLLSEYKARGLFEDMQDLDIAGLETEPAATQEMYIQELAKRLYEEARNNPGLKDELETVLTSLTDYRGGSDIPPNGSIPYAGTSVNPLNPKNWQDYIKQNKYRNNHISDFELKTPIL